MDQNVETGQTATLDGSGSSDADGDTLTYQWTLLTAPSGGTASIVNDTSETAQLSPDAAGSWEIQLVVYDGKDYSLPDTVTIQVASCTSAAQCDDSSDCTTDTCDNGECVNTPLAEGTSCDDGTYCNGEETCDAAGACQFGALPCPGRACDEGNDTCVGCTADDVCPLCQYCSNGACVNQADGDDVKDDCAQDVCNPGYCDGSGACATEPDTTDCDVCGACDSGACVVDLTQDADCPLCQECTDLATCGNQAADSDVKSECPDADFCDGAEACDGAGACQATGPDPCPGLVCDETNDICTGCLTDADCPLCTECVANNCENQALGTDVKDDCAQDSCHTGDCDGAGACGLEAQGTDCGQCQACDNTGACVDNLSQDADCPTCQQCAAGGACANQSAGVDIKDECTDSAICNGLELCDGNGACTGGTDSADGTPCDEGAGSTGDECDSSCLTGVCTAATPPTCNDGLDCNGLETCVTGSGCSPGTDAADGAPCDEGAGQDTDFCNSSCVSGVCAAATAATCDDTLMCNGTETCNTASGCVAGTDAVDGVPCDEGAGSTGDECDSSCVSGVCTAATAPICDDGVVCNGAEICTTGTGCENAGTNAADGTACDEGAGQDTDWCNSSCVTGTCTAATPPTCGDALVCNGVDSCNTASGCETATPPGDGAPCDEGAGQDTDWCNSSCQSGVCAAATAATCDDTMMCNGTETCNTASGCVAGTDAVDGVPCDEGAGSTGDECDSSCVSGVCTAATAPICDDGVVCNGAEICTTGTGCENSGTNADDGTACDEGAGQDTDWCNSSCVSGTCTAATPPTCDDTMMCNGTETCVTASGCAAGTDATDGTPCDEGAGQDSNECNSSCQSGICDAATAADCGDGVVCNGAEICTVGTGCEAGTAAADDTACDEGAGQDSDMCNSSCQSGVCAAATPPVCGDALICNGVDSCDTGTGCLTATPPGDGAPCDEGAGQDTDWCNSSCVSGTCTAATPPTCDDTLMCNGTETCVTASGCAAGTDAADDTPCDEGAGQDSDECNSSCQSGVCDAATAPTCDDGLDCNGLETCVTGTGCSPGTDAADGAPCDEGAGQDSDECNSSCQSGVCAAATAPTCDDSLMCNGVEACVTGSGCTATAEPDGTPCDEGAGQDSNECNSSCQSGVCDGSAAAVCDDALLCNGAETCTVGTGCVAGTDATDGTPCDEGAGQDGNDCNSSCQSGTCAAGTNATTGLTCADGFECTATDQCDGSGNCAGTKDDTFCDNLVSGDLCRPECFGGTSGCGTPPASMTLVCAPNPVDLGTVDTTTCTLDLGTLTAQEIACLYCYSEVGLVTFEYNGFDACAAGGWTMVTGSNCSSTVASCTPDVTPAEACCETFSTICVTAGPNSLLTSDLATNCSAAGNEEWRIEKTFDFSDAATISVCYDVGGSGATGTEGVLVYAYDGTNGPTLVDCQNGDNPGVDFALYRHCAVLPGWAEDNAAVTIQFAGHSEANAQGVFLDNIEITGWHSACTPANTAVLDEDFSTCTSGSPLAADFNGWTVTGTVNCAQTFDCPAATLHAEVTGGMAGLTKQLDASDLDGEVTLCFAYGDNGSAADKTLVAMFDTGSGPQAAWGQSGDAGTDGECANICVNLSNIDPAVNRNPALTISFMLDSTTDIIAVDNITLRGAQFCDGASTITLGAYTDNSDGTYTFTALNALGEQLNADILCSWDTPPTGEEVEAVEAVWYQP